MDHREDMGPREAATLLDSRVEKGIKKDVIKTS